MSVPSDIAAALHERLNCIDAIPKSMPPSFYNNPAVYKEEVEKVFLNSWVCVGRIDEVPNVGDYYTHEIFNEPLIIVRQSPESVSVLSNVCRHRGSLILQGSGNEKRFTCPYHRWSYQLDGQLLAAPLVDKSPNFDAKQCNLPSFRSVNWMGWIFVNLDGKANDFHEEILGLDAYVENYHAEEMRSINATTEYWNLNWKCLAENFMEGYHLTPVHRKTLHPMTPTKLCKKIAAGHGYTGYKSHYNPSFKGRSQVHPDMSVEEKSTSMMVWIYPSFVAAVSPNSAVYMSITPTGGSQLQTRWDVIGRDDIFESDEAQARHDFAKAFNLEDRERLLDVQHGLQSRYATRGYLAPPDLEGTVWDFYAYMAKKLAE